MIPVSEISDAALPERALQRIKLYQLAAQAADKQWQAACLTIGNLEATVAGLRHQLELCDPARVKKIEEDKKTLLMVSLILAGCLTACLIVLTLRAHA